MGTPLQDLLAGVPDPCVFLRPIHERGAIVDFEYVDANEAACTYNGMSYDELMGKRLLELYPYHDRCGLLGRYAEVMRTGIAMADADLTLPPDAVHGAYRFFDIFATRIGDQLILRWRDRTREHLQAERLAESERRYRVIADQISDVVYECDADGVILWVSPSVTEALGWTPEELLGRRAMTLVAPDDVPGVQPHRDSVVFQGRTVAGVECRFVTKAGECRWMSVSSRPLKDDRGVVTGSVVGLRDVHQEVLLRRAVDTLSAANSILVRARDESSLLQSMCEVAVDAGGYVFAWYGRPLADEGRPVQAVASTSAHRDYLAAIKVSWGDNPLGHGPTGTAIREGATQIVADFMRSRSTAPWRSAAAERGFRSSIGLPVFVGGAVDGALMVYAAEVDAFDDAARAVMEDLAAQLGYGIARLRDATRLALALEERVLLSTAIDQASEAIVVTDLTPTIRYANPAVERSTGFAPEELIGQNPRIFQSGLHDEHFYEEMWARLVGGRTWRGVLTNRRKNGELFEEDASITPIHDEHGDRIAYVAVKHDLTRERSLEAAVTRDQLDRDAIVAVLRDVRPGESLMASGLSLCRAVRRFERIDGVMVMLVREDGTVAPLAADSPMPEIMTGEFPFDPDRMATLAEVSANGPWWTDFRNLSGIAGTDPAMSATLVEAGFTAAAYAPIRWEGRMIGVLAVGTQSPDCDQWMPGRLPVLAELGSFAGMLLGPQAIAHSLHEAHRAQIMDIIDHERFHAVFEPVVHLATGLTVGFEALTRFDSGIAPDRCFDLAQSVGLGSALESECARVALRDAACLPADAWLAVNFSPSAVIDGSVEAVVRGADRDIVVEITEHNQIDNYTAVRRAIERCGDVRIAVDDAGAGFASLRHILELQPDIIKLDIGLVRDIDSDPARQALAAGLRHFAALTETTLVAEGVETEAEARTVRQLGVELAQGFLFGRVPQAARLPLP